MTEPDTDSAAPGAGDPLWIELPPHIDKTPTRLLVVLHGAGSRPEAFVPIALAWQFRFPSAAAIVMQGIEPANRGYGHNWYDPASSGETAARLAATSAAELARRIAYAQKSMNLDAARTIVIGFSQGGSVALELARQETQCAQIIVAHAARLLRPIAPGTRLPAHVHLLHGELDSQVLAQQSLRSFRALRDAGACVTLDVLADGIHSIGQDMINVGTMRAMQTVFNRRKRIDIDQFHASLTVSIDSNEPDPEKPARVSPETSKPH